MKNQKSVNRFIIKFIKCFCLIYCLFLLIAVNLFAQGPEYLWVNSSSGIGNDDCNGIATDDIGNVYIAGAFHNDITFDSITLNSQGGWDIFVAKFNNKGEVLWAKRAGGTSGNGANDLAIDHDGNCVVVGAYSGIAFFDGIELASNGLANIFVAKYDSLGNLLWAKSAGGHHDDWGYGVAVNSMNEIIVTGFFGGVAMFDNIRLQSHAGGDIFIAKYDDSGSIVWAKNAGGGNNDKGSAVAVDKNDHIYITGSFNEQSFFDDFYLSGFRYEVFIAKYNNTGDVIWVRQGYGDHDDYGNDIDVDDLGNVIATGSYYWNPIRFENITLDNAGEKDVFAVKYDPFGDLIWAKRAGGGGPEKGISIITDNSSKIYVTGYYDSSPFHFGEFQVETFGGYDIFVAAYDVYGNELWLKNAGGTDEDRARCIAIDNIGNIFVSGHIGSPTAYFDDIEISSATPIDVFVAKVGWSVELRLPADQIILPDSTLKIPIKVTTNSNISLAQFVVEYDSTIISYQNAEIGSGVNGFQITGENTNLPFEAFNPNTNKNLLLQIASSDGDSSFTGDEIDVVLLNFDVIGEYGDSTFICFDEETNHTYLTTVSLYDINNGQIDFNNGVFKIPNKINVSGQIRYDEQSNGVQNVELLLDDTLSIVTDNDGNFQFEDVLPGVEHTIVPAKTGDHQSAISGTDPLLILQALAFLRNLTPAQKIAADVTMDGLVTASDAIAILRHLAFFTEGIANTGHWLFYPQDTSFMSNSDFRVDFSAYLLGDVNLSWNSGSENMNDSEHVFKHTDFTQLQFCFEQTKSENQKVRVPIKVDNVPGEINTIIMTIQYNAELLEYDNILWHSVTQNFMIAVNSFKEGEVNIALAGREGIEYNATIFELIFTKTGIESDRIQVEITRAEVNDFKVLNLPTGVVSETNIHKPTAYALFQNYPNPFNPETRIDYQLPEKTNVTIEIFNLMAQKIRTILNREQAAGYHSVVWDCRDDSGKMMGSGVYLYRIKAGEFSKARKMLLMK